MRCPGCGKNIDESILPPPLTYCPYCGQNLKASSTERVIEGILFCPYCGKELPGKVSFCPYCGAELAKYITIDYDKLKEGESTERGAKPIIEPLPGQRKGKGIYGRRPRKRTRSRGARICSCSPAKRATA